MTRIGIGLLLIVISLSARAGLIPAPEGTWLRILASGVYVWAAFGLVLVVAGALDMIRNTGTVQRDSTRMFSSRERTDGFARAGGRCELEIIPFVRCRRAPTHGDHYIPWSKGGATNMANFVAACRTCNLRKSDSVPSAFARWRLEQRRKKYFPPGVPVIAGDRALGPRSPYR